MRFLLLFFLSGFTALLYEVLWIRKVTQIFGSTLQTTSLTLSIFLFGLFFGSICIEKLCRKYPSLSKSPLRSYGLIEIIVGLYGIIFPFIFILVKKLSVDAFPLANEHPILYEIIKMLSISTLIFIPTSLMGMTLPLLTKHFSQSNSFLTSLSRLYALNTIGGAIGVLISGFFLIETFGLDTTLRISAVINLILGFSTLILINESKLPLIKQSQIPSLNSGLSIKADYLLFAFISGFIGLSLEIIWMRGLKILLQSSNYSFVLILFIFLTGIGIGSLIITRIVRNSKDIARRFGIIQILLGFYIIFTGYFLYYVGSSSNFLLQFLDPVYKSNGEWYNAIPIYILSVSIIFLIPSIFIGMSYPLLNLMYFDNSKRKDHISSTGLFYGINVLGGIFGLWFTAYFFIPSIGIKNSLIIIAAISSTVGLYFIQVKSKTSYFLIFIFFILSILLISNNKLTGREELTANSTLFYEEGLMSTVKVFSSASDTSMSVDGNIIASTNIAFLKKEKMVAHLPFFLKPNIKSVLAVGLGSGITVGSMSLYSDVDIDCIEISRSVFKGAKLFSNSNNNAFSNPSVKMFENDAYAFLNCSSKKYDLISSDGKLGSINQGNTMMLSLDYYRLCKNHLSEDGIFIQWIPLITPYKVFDVIRSTINKSFKFNYYFYQYPSDIFIVSSDSPLNMGLTSGNSLLRLPLIKEDLATIDIVKCSSIMSTYIGSNVASNKLDKTNSLDKPVIENMIFKEWKSGANIEGGHRAENLKVLIEGFTADSRNCIFYQGLTKKEAWNLYKSSGQFFSFCSDNFKWGNYEKGSRAYSYFKSSIPF